MTKDILELRAEFIDRFGDADLFDEFYARLVKKVQENWPSGRLLDQLAPQQRFAMNYVICISKKGVKIMKINIKYIKTPISSIKVKKK